MVLRFEIARTNSRTKKRTACSWRGNTELVPTRFEIRKNTEQTSSNGYPFDKNVQASSCKRVMVMPSSVNVIALASTMDSHAAVASAASGQRDRKPSLA